MTAPDGWDEIDPETLEMAKTFRKMFVAFLAAGFTYKEAVNIIAQMWAALGANVTDEGSVGDKNG